MSPGAHSGPMSSRRIPVASGGGSASTAVGATMGAIASTALAASHRPRARTMLEGAFHRAGDTRPHGPSGARAHYVAAASVIADEGDPGIRLDHPEAEALLQVQAHVLGIMGEVPDRHVLSAVEHEVPSPQADYDGALPPWGPYHGALEDAVDVIEQEVPAVLGGL